MEKRRPEHLDSDQLLQAVVGESDLPRHLRIHLTQCTTCRQEVDRLGARFSAIGKMARDLSPDALGRVRLSERRRRFFLGRRVGLRPALGMAVAMVLLMLIALYRPLGHRSTPAPPASIVNADAALSPETEARLLAEIQGLLDNPLPEDYQRITGEDSLFGIAGDPSDVIVPDVEAETDKELGLARPMKGTA
ncbi:MAG: hypothetical protein P8010_23305 [Desulfosarcinaceae bacterium]|jgi:hypothetical protein